jgi:ABC-type glycerol-3-phosphate transport system permease component
MAVTTRTGDAGPPTTAPPRQPEDRRARRAGDVGVNVLSHVVLIGWSVMVLVPFTWALLASVKTSGEIFGSPWALPESCSTASSSSPAAWS